MITAFGTIESAIAATKQGAFHYFTKPFKNDEVLVVLRNARRAAPAGRARIATLRRPAAGRMPTGSTRSSAAAPKMPRRLRPDRPRRAEPDDGADSGRERHGQGTGRAGAPPPIRRAPTRRSSRSTPATCRRTCSNRTSSATSRARSPAPSTRRRACSSWPTRARSSSTRSATSRSRRRPSCCA